MRWWYTRRAGIGMNAASLLIINNFFLLAPGGRLGDFSA